MSLTQFLVQSWRIFLPTGLALAALALVTGFFADSAAPAWIFAIAVAVGLVGLAGLVLDLVLRARARVEDMLDGDDDPTGPSGPTGPKIDRG